MRHFKKDAEFYDRLKELIMEVLDANSGGCKRTQLITDALAEIYDNWGLRHAFPVKHIGVHDIDNALLQLIMEKKIDKVEYTWGPMNRQKEFYFTP